MSSIEKHNYLHIKTYALTHRHTETHIDTYTRTSEKYLKTRKELLKTTHKLAPVLPYHWIYRYRFNLSPPLPVPFNPNS